jgi:hypothetical protein
MSIAIVRDHYSAIANLLNLLVFYCTLPYGIFNVSCYDRFDKKEADLLTSLGRLEIEREDETSTLFRYFSLQSRAVDPDTVPDPAVQVNPDPDPGFS